VPQQGTLSPKVVTASWSLLVKRRVGMQWTGSVDVGALVTGAVAVSVLGAAGRRLMLLSFERELSD